MASTVTVASVVARARSAADVQDADESLSIVTDAELLVWLNDAYKILFELISAEAGEEYFATSASINLTTFALPADFFRELGVDILDGGIVVAAKPFNFAERNIYHYCQVPRFRVQNGHLVWEPPTATPTTTVTLWYVPTPAALAGNGSFDSINGWDTLVTNYLVREIKRKQDYPLDEANALYQESVARVQHQAARIRAYSETVSDVTTCVDEAYFAG